MWNLQCLKVQSLRLVKVSDWGGDTMVKDSVLISGGVNLGASPSAPGTSNNITVTFGGQVIEPILVLGSSLDTNCRAILVPYGAEVTIKVLNGYNLLVCAIGDTRPIIQYSAGTTNKFLAVRDLYLQTINISTLLDENAPT